MSGPKVPKARTATEVAAARNLFDDPKMRVALAKARLGDAIEHSLYLASSEPTHLNPKQQADIIVNRLFEYLVALAGAT